MNLSGDKPDAMVLRNPAAQHLHLNELARRYPNALMGTMALARQALLDARRYGDEWAAYEKAPAGKKRPRFDPSLAAWQDVAAGRQTLIVTATRANDIRRALALADEFKVKVAVAGAPQAARLAALVKERKLPLLVSVNFDPPRATSFFGGADEEQEKKDIEEAEANPAALHQAGVSFALVSAWAPSFTAGIQKAIERGLPRDVALQAVTLRAAEVLGVADRAGQPGAGQDRQPGGLAGRPPREGREGEDGLRGRLALRARGQGGGQEGRRPEAGAEGGGNDRGGQGRSDHGGARVPRCCGRLLAGDRLPEPHPTSPWPSSAAPCSRSAPRARSRRARSSSAAGRSWRSGAT